MGPIETSKGSHRANAPRVIFAIEDEGERAVFSAAMEASSPGCVIHFPSNIADVERIYAADEADAIVTDFRFHGGALADWLTFWPLPCILLIDVGEDLDRVQRTTRDEAALFIERRPEAGHIRFLPLMIRKSLNIRESGERQNAHMQMTERQYLNLLQAVPDIVYILDSDGRFVYLNESARALGFEPARLIGKHFSEIVHPADVPKVSRIEILPELLGSVTGDDSAPKLFDERRTGQRMTRNLELRLKHGDGDMRYGSVTAYGEISSTGYKLPEFQGAELGTVGIIRDVSARKKHERELESALAAKEILLKEIHHRVKNNLQVISSLLNLQEGAFSDAAAHKVFVECQTQIQSMAMVHEVLYRSSVEGGVEMQIYFEHLVDYLSGIYDGSLRGIAWSVEAPVALLGLDEAIPVALIVNELVSNAYKHAFPANAPKGGCILVRMLAREAKWILEVEDDGIGFAAARSREGPCARSGIGTELVNALAAQIRGSAELSPRAEASGSLWTIVFPRLEAK